MTIKVKPWGKDQGEYVIIEEEDFNPEIHEKADQEPEAVEPAKRGRKPRE
jgi:hypothetical protein